MRGLLAFWLRCIAERLDPPRDHTLHVLVVPSVPPASQSEWDEILGKGRS